MRLDIRACLALQSDHGCALGRHVPADAPSPKNSSERAKKKADNDFQARLRNGRGDPI